MHVRYWQAVHIVYSAVPDSKQGLALTEALLVASEGSTTHGRDRASEHVGVRA